MLKIPLALLVLFWPCLSATIFWDGGGGNNSWATAANWNTDAVPTSADDVVFNGSSSKTCVVDQPAFAGSFTIDPGFSGNVSNAASIGSAGNQVAFKIRGGTFNLAAASVVNSFAYAKNWTQTGGMVRSPADAGAYAAYIYYYGSINVSGGTFANDGNVVRVVDANDLGTVNFSVTPNTSIRVQL